VLLPEFLVETAMWCPQERSGCCATAPSSRTTQRVELGVPMVCWPAFADQHTNCNYACELWGVGRRLTLT
jgi:hypothetical protein